MNKLLKWFNKITCREAKIKNLSEAVDLLMRDYYMVDVMRNDIHHLLKENDCYVNYDWVEFLKEQDEYLIHMQTHSMKTALLLYNSTDRGIRNQVDWEWKDE